MIRSAFLLFAAAVLTVASPCFAEIEMPADANGAKQEIPTSFLQREGRDWLVWVAYEGYRPKEKWSEDAAPAEFRLLKFMESFRVLYRHEGRKGDYLLLGESDASGQHLERVVGWVRRDCTVGPEAVKVPGIYLHRKVMLVTTAKTTRQDGDNTDMVVPILNAPKKEGADRKSFNLFSIFFIYGRTNQAQYEMTDEEEYVLIGNAQQFRTDAWAEGPLVDGSPENVIQGWVPVRRVAFWNTREAMAWDRPSTLASASPRRTVRGRVFPSAKDAKDALDALDGVAVADKTVLLREVFDDQSQSVPFQPHHMRYPILEWKAEDLRLSEPGEDPPRYMPRKYKGNELLKIGAIVGYRGLTIEDSTEIGAEYETILRDAGIDIEKVKAQGDVPLFREGYVWRYAPGPTRGVPQVRVQLMLDTLTIEGIIVCMEKLINQLGPIGGNMNIERALAELVRAATGEEPDPNLSVEDQIFKRKGLVAKSPLLRRPVGPKFAPRLAFSEIIEIAHRVDLLKDILEGKQRKWDKQQGMLAGEPVPKYVAVGDAKDFDRHFTILGSTLKWYWIDVEDEFP